MGFFRAKLEQMIRLRIFLLPLLALGVIGCYRHKAPKEPPCQPLFSKLVPEVAALKAKPIDEDETNQGLPFEGLELALTINAATKNDHEPDNDEEDLCFTGTAQGNFERLLDALRQNEMPPTIDFVVGRSWDGKLRQEWLDHGNLFGNSTFEYSKTPLVPVSTFVDDIDKLDKVLAPVLTASHQTQKYFRYPGLRAGTTDRDRVRINEYLKKNGYAVVPATINALDREFNLIYCAAQHRGDQTCVSLTKSYFFSLLRQSTLKARAAIRQAARRDAKQILMVWATQFTYDNLAEVLQWYKRLGARFIGLDEALRDSFYAKTGKDGESLAMAIANTIKDEEATQ